MPIYQEQSCSFGSIPSTVNQCSMNPHLNIQSKFLGLLLAPDVVAVFLDFVQIPKILLQKKKNIYIGIKYNTTYTEN